MDTFRILYEEAKYFISDNRCQRGPPSNFHLQTNGVIDHCYKSWINVCMMGKHFQPLRKFPYSRLLECIALHCSNEQTHACHQTIRTGVRCWEHGECLSSWAVKSMLCIHKKSAMHSLLQKPLLTKFFLLFTHHTFCIWDGTT